MTTLDEKLDIKMALRVFQKIIDHGKRSEAGYTLNGLTAISDIDGYNVSLTDEYVTLHILFHSRYTLDFSRRKDLIVFLDRLHTLDRQTFN